MLPSPYTRDPAFWRPEYFKVFITHISRYRDAAAKLQRALLWHQITSFVAHADVQPTREWESEILSAIRTADALVALLHTGFRDSLWTDQEIGVAIGRDVLPLSISFGETPYGFIGRCQALPGRGKSYDQLAEEVFRIFLTHRQSRRRMAEVLVIRLTESGSFDEARRNMRLLEGVEYWDDELTKAVRKAVETNDQLSEAWGIPDRIEALIKGWKRDELPF